MAKLSRQKRERRGQLTLTVHPVQPRSLSGLQLSLFPALAAPYPISNASGQDDFDTAEA
ncbi:MAG: hypothetical protein QNJ46_24355 [Leptolyngbyaceae cyanobacterium MO_188.B28]|nr:hypothetical protein [Leptolyngbyaceae cyanobacterium MO_188.B28]